MVNITLEDMLASDHYLIRKQESLDILLLNWQMQF